MMPALKKRDEVIFNLVHKPVFLGDPARPTTRQGVLKGFGLANTFEGIRARVLDELVDLFAFALIVLLPKGVVFYEFRRTGYPKRFHFW